MSAVGQAVERAAQLGKSLARDKASDRAEPALGVQERASEGWPRLPAWALASVVAWAIFFVYQLVTGWIAVPLAFIDSDDAMRLVQIRDLLAGQGWWDLTQFRMGAPDGVSMHWSRLVDAPMALIIRAAMLVTNQATAERIMMTVWPPLVFLPAILSTAAAARRVGGERAGVTAAFFTLLCVALYSFFQAGRIDHHNVQIASTMVFVAATIWSGRDRRGPITAGLAAAFMLAVGTETLAYFAVGCMIFGARFVMEGESFAYAARRFGLALALGTAVFFVATVPPTHWSDTACEALALNLAALAGLGGLGLAGLTLRAPATAAGRLLALAAVGGLAGAVFVALDPSCARGPLAAIDPRLYPIWLDHVREARPLLAVWATQPSAVVITLAFPLAGLAGAAVLWRLCPDRRVPVLCLALFLAAACLVMVPQIRAFPYANIMAAPLMAALAVEAADRAKGLSRSGAVLLAALLLNPLTVGLIAAAASPAESASGDTGLDCLKRGDYRDLALLPRGRVAIATGHGAFVLAETPHDVVAGPYHRGVRGIIDTSTIMAGNLDLARQTVRSRQVDYLVECRDSGEAKGIASRDPQGLLAALRRGEVPDWLEPLTGEDGQALRIYRVKR